LGRKSYELLESLAGSLVLDADRRVISADNPLSAFASLWSPPQGKYRAIEPIVLTSQEYNARADTEEASILIAGDWVDALSSGRVQKNMGAPLDNTHERVRPPGQGPRASSANQPSKPEGMVLPWLMTMPSPSEDIKISGRPEEKWEPAQSYSAPKGPCEPMPMPDGAGSTSPAFPAGGEDDTASSSNLGIAAMMAPQSMTRPLPGDNISEERNPTETNIVLMRQLRIAEHKGGNAHTAPETSAERPKENSDACAPDITPPTPGLELKEKIANVDSRLHPVETYVVPEAVIATSAEHKNGNSHAAPECETEKLKEVLEGTNERYLLLRANHPVSEDELASVAQANQLVGWIWPVSVVNNAPPFPSGPDGFKRSDVAVPAQRSRVAVTQRSRKGSPIILVAIIFTATALCIWATGLMPVLSSHREDSVGAETIVATQPGPNVAQEGSTPPPSTPAAEQKSRSDEENSVALSENFSRPSKAPQRVGGPIGWRRFEVPEFGTRVQVPASIFTPAGRPEQGSGQRFERADGRAVLSVYSHPNSMRDSPASYLRRNLQVDRLALDYTRIARSFFVISWERDGVILYSRCNFSSRVRAAIHCFDLTYPQEEKRSWDRVITRMSLSLRPLEG
jgi:hypothetical protein